jgi:sucrose-6-phosphate hydrolase SacC (GH32 family)
LRQEQWSEKELALTPKSPIDAPVGGELLDIDVNIDLGQADAVGVKVRGVPIWYDRRVGALFCGSYTVLVPTDLRSLQLRILVDRASIEVFADRGAILIAAGIVLPPEDQKVIIFASGGQATVRNIRVSELRSAWGGQN